MYRPNDESHHTQNNNKEGANEEGFGGWRLKEAIEGEWEKGGEGEGEDDRTVLANR
jgi:hypothetical protein